MIEDLKNKLTTFDNDCLVKAYNKVRHQYDNLRKEEDFAKINNE